MVTSFAVTQTDRFRAASMGAGLPNLISMVTTTDIGDYLVGHMGEEYFDNYEAIYGSLGGVIVTLLFFYILAVIFVLGAEINAMVLRRYGAD